jgi:flagellar biosynthesis/type III secretory pathway ATPase
MLIDAGLYAKGSNEGIDRAIERHPHIVRFLKQERSERSTLDLTNTALGAVIGERG